MVDALNEFARKMSRPEKFIYSTCDTFTYCMNIDSNIIENMAYGDYNGKTRKMKYITVVYPSSYYAVDAYLTTMALNGIYTPGMTLDNYFSAILDYIAI